jgi:hypothetical protein
LLYTDTYFLASEPEVFFYARHKSSPENFFNELNFFVDDLTREMPELRREFNLIFNISGKIGAGPRAFPIHPRQNFLSRIRFFRLDFPFGALTIEFGAGYSAGDQIELLKEGMLSRKSDSPLIGCDMTEGPIFSPLLTRLHWEPDKLTAGFWRILLPKLRPIRSLFEKLIPDKKNDRFVLNTVHVKNRVVNSKGDTITPTTGRRSLWSQH